MTKIKEEQLSKLQEQQAKLSTLLTKIGGLEANKHALLHEIAGVNKDVEEFKVELENEYGAININLETGEYSKIEQNEPNKED